jgi:ribosomal protein S18 acetylase RimI-like enzyme
MGDDRAWLIRDALPSDLAYVKNTWVKSFGDSPWGQSLNRAVYREGHSRLVEALTERCAIAIACDTEDTDVVFGWLAYEGGVVHFCYVREAMRRQGIARSLLGDKADVAQQYTHPAGRVRVPPKWVWNPYALAAPQ